MALEAHDQEIVNDIKAVAARLGLKEGDSFGRSEYVCNGARFSHYDLYQNDKTWGCYCQAAGFADKTKKPISDEVYFQRLRVAFADLGRMPMVSDRKKYCLNFSKSRWPTLDSFISDAIQRGEIAEASKSKPMRRGASVPFLAVTMTLPLLSKSTNIIAPIPSNSKRKKWTRINLPGFPYAPQDEQGVVAIFVILCSRGVLPWQIVDLNGGKGIDADCYDICKHDFIRIEFKYQLTKYSFNHHPDSFDVVVCWTNKWPDIGKEVIELKSLLQTLPTDWR